MANYFFNPQPYPEIGRRDEAADDVFLFNQGPARGLGKITFHDIEPAFAGCSLPNVEHFFNQVERFKQLLAFSSPDEDQQKDVDFLMALGEIFALVVYAHLILENAAIYRVEDALLDQIFDVLVRDLSGHALELYSKPSSTPGQMEHCLAMIHKPAEDPSRTQAVWQEQVLALKDLYEMKP
jgi:acyl-CoA dehydrogenase